MYWILGFMYIEEENVWCIYFVMISKPQLKNIVSVKLTMLLSELVILTLTLMHSLFLVEIFLQRVFVLFQFGILGQIQV